MPEKIEVWKTLDGRMWEGEKNALDWEQTCQKMEKRKIAVEKLASFVRKRFEGKELYNIDFQDITRNLELRENFFGEFMELCNPKEEQTDNS